MADEKKKKVNPKEKGIDLNTPEGKAESLKNALAQIEKQFGKGAVMKLGENTRNKNIKAVPTGCLSLDIAIGIGGIPRGRIIEIYGPESSGKTTLALHMVAEVQKIGGIAAFVDAEHALDPVYAKNLGVNIDELYISQPDDGEQALEITETMVRSGAVDIIIVDSVAALVPKAEINGEMGDSHMGLQARLMSQALRKLTGIIGKSECIVIFINQLREKIGNSYGPSETTTGGRALKFYASIRIDVRKSEYIKVGSEIVGSRTKAKIAKNKVAPPFKTVEFDIMYGKGVSHMGDVLDLAAEINIVNKSGSWYSYGEMRLGQGRENAKAYLEQNTALAEEIEAAVRNYYELGVDDSESKSDSESEKKEEKTKKQKKNNAEEEAIKLPDDEEFENEEFDEFGSLGGFDEFDADSGDMQIIEQESL